MTKRQHNEFSQRRELQDANFRVVQRDSVAFNSGSETVRHAVCKMLAAYVLKERGYRIDSEVENPGGEVDILAYANDEGDCIVVECETSPTDEVVKDKIERYVYGHPPRDCFVLNVSEMPEDVLEAYGWVKDQL